MGVYKPVRAAWIPTIEITSTEISLRVNCTQPAITEVVVSPFYLPVVKWAGGKQWLARAANNLAPHDFGRYFEPFAGGAAFFFALEPSTATLTDTNEELIQTYDAVRTNPDGVIRQLRRYPHDEDFFYALRAKTPRSAVRVAARMLYLNRTCWNGLYRLNLAGKFNTPFGRYKNPTICDEERLRRAGELLRRTRLKVGDFEETTRKAKAGDFVYFDPPYITGHTNNGFVKYNAKLFAWNDQERLAKVARHLAEKGVFVLVSNANHRAVLRLYRGMHHYQVSRNSVIGAERESRQRIVEALISSYPLFGVENRVED